jgi:hypothetical protein
MKSNFVGCVQRSRDFVVVLKQITPRTVALGQSLMIAVSYVHLLLNGLFPFLVFDIISFPYLNIDFS